MEPDIWPPRHDDVDFDRFAVGDRVMYYAGDAYVNEPGWHVGVITQIDRNDPESPWLVRVDSRDRREVRYELLWVADHEALMHEFVIEEF